MGKPKTVGVPIVAEPFTVRVVVAAVAVLYAIRRDWPWLVVLACVLATPALYGWGAMGGWCLATLVAYELPVSRKLHVMDDAVPLAV